MKYKISTILFPIIFAACSLPCFGQFTDVAGSTGLDVGGSKDGGMSWADFNQDGCLDLLINTNHNSSGYRSRILVSDCNLPNPSFTDVTVTHATGLNNVKSERSAIWGDINNDGYIDFIRNSHTRIEVYLNQGPNGSPAWSFGDANHNCDYSITTLVGGFNSEGLGLIDFNGDGFLDLLIENHSFGVDILQNPGDCSANFAHVTPNTSTLGLPTSATDGDYLATGDFNDDGKVDFVARKNNGEDIFTNQGGTFTIGQDLGDASNNNKGGVVLADFDNDGDQDLLWTAQGTNQIWEQTGLNSGNFIATGEPSTSASVAIGVGIDGCAVGDIDNDGDVDIFLSDDSGASLLFENNSTTTNWSFALTNNGINVAGDGEGCSFIDYDNDGDLDLYINRNGADNQLWRNGLNDNNFLFVKPMLDLGGGFKRVDHGANVSLLNADGTILLTGSKSPRMSFGHGCQSNSRVHFGLPSGPDAFYTVRIKFTEMGGVRKEMDITIKPSSLTNNTLEIIADDYYNGGLISCNILPIELLEFNATPNENEVELKWTTLSETMNDFFTIERSNDNENFHAIGIVEGNGTTLNITDYSFLDVNPPNNVLYYRLKQTDFNGSYSYSQTEAVIREYNQFEVKVWPNPLSVNDKSLQVLLSGLTRNDKLEIKILDINGKSVFESNSIIEQDFIKLELDLDQELKAGAYFIKIRTSWGVITRKLILK